MTDFVTLPDASLNIGKPVTSSIAKRLRDNPTAMAEGNSEAPKIWHQARRHIDFTASGTFEVPQGCTKVFVQLCGGGAGSTYDEKSPQCGGYAEKECTVVPGDLIPVTIGAGGLGAGVSNSPLATNGGTTSFGSYVSATGGAAFPSALGNTPWSSALNDQDKADWILKAVAGVNALGVGVGGDFNISGAVGYMPGFGRGSRRHNPNSFPSGGPGITYGESGMGGTASGGGYDGKHGFIRVWY